VAAVRYPPRGVRGVAGTTRASKYGRVPNYAKVAEAEVCLLVQVETRSGLDNLDAIASTDGVDGVFIGPADLAAGLGHLGEIPHPEVQSAIEDAIRRIRARGKPAGILSSDEPSTRRYMQWGTIFTAVGMDAMLLSREADKLAKQYK
jgi:4-hydroxy-2-oxoheptanedioate aldolase